MTVNELIKKLEKMPQNMQVVGHTLCCDNTAPIIDIAIIGGEVHIMKDEVRK